MRVLLIMPNFFNYPEIIVDELEGLGYDVDCFDDRPSTNAWIKALIRINKKLIYNYISNYFDEIMLTIKARKYDVVFLISGQSLSFTEEMIKSIKECQANARFILYQWDSLSNFPYIRLVHKYFDKCYSFDREDCNKIPYLNFLPLFYSKQYERIGLMKKNDYKYDFCFVGTAHPKKYKFINLMSSQLKDVYPKQFIYFFFPSRIVYFYRKFMNREFRKARYNEFHYIPLSQEQMNTVYENSRCILDSPQAEQRGLTIRVIEAIGARKKLITTNKDIENYDFYCSENIYIYDGEFDYEDDFFKSPYIEIEQEIYEKYSLRNWLIEILKGN